MSPRNHIGSLSLVVTCVGFALMEGLRHFGIASTPAWFILQSGFEAGMVGGCADWFAVSALFRPIPSARFCLPHTNIIVRSRATLSEGIVDMVQNRWLSPETLAEHLSRLSASRFILEHLATPEARTQVLEAVRDLLGRFAGSLDAPEIAAFLDRALRDQLAGLDLGPALGRWLEARVAAGDTRALWDTLAGSLAHSAEQGDFDDAIRKMLETAAANYKERGFWERLKGGMGELFFDYEELSQTIAGSFAENLRAIQNEALHPLRGKLDEQLTTFAQRLAQGDPEACAALVQFQQRLTQHAELGPFLARVLSRLQVTLREQLRQPSGPLSQVLDQLLENLLQEFCQEPDTQAHLDAWVRRTVLDLATRNHYVIGEMVASALAKLSDGDLVAQIEEKVGSDLQYIRLNGAVVGGLVGMGLAVLKLALAR